jgi:SAM-dependent MidA family methyltransferase
MQQIKVMPDGFMPFEQWMHLALYAPGLGYYAAGNTKFGGDRPEGDFTTAPELTPLFGQAVAKQVAEILHASGSNHVLEFGAGSGALAASIIPALQALGITPHYQILEVSAELRARQQHALAPWGATVTWLDALPDAFRGCVLANEVLDAMPATLFGWTDDAATVNEIGVVVVDDANADSPFAFAERAAPLDVQDAVRQRMPPLAGYRSELNLQAEAWVREMGTWLEHGAALLIDYGFPQREYYHPQRATGTLMCHFRHHAHSEPLIHAGLQDITTHVDFTAMADAALAAGMDVLGYTSQARFLMNTGLPELLLQTLDRAATLASATSPQDATIAATRSLSGVQRLLSEAEMGELFKVLAIGRGIEPPLLGFVRGDRRDRL